MSMNSSLPGGRRSQLNDYEEIDRAMLDCFAESMGPMDYSGGTSFALASDYLYASCSDQHEPYQFDNDLNLEAKVSSRHRLQFTESTNPNQESQMGALQKLYRLQSNSSSFSNEPALTEIDRNDLGTYDRDPLDVLMNGDLEVPSIPATKSELKSQHVIVSRERRRERNKFLARKTRVKKKAEIESLWAQVSQLRTENERLKESLRVSTPKSTESILMDCDFQLPQKVADQLEIMMEGTKQSGPDNNALRSFLITNATAPDGPIVFASPDFVKLTGYAMHSILGHNCRFLQGPDTDRNELNKLKLAIKEGKEETVTIKNYRRDGTSFWNRTQIYPMRDDNGKISLIIGIQTEVYQSSTDGEDFSTEDPLAEKRTKTSFCSKSDRSESYGCITNEEGEGSSGNGGSEDGTTDCTNDEESNSGSTNGSEAGSHST